MSYSSLASAYIPSPCNWGKRPGPVTKITIHHMAVVNGDPVAVARALADPNRHASATYCIGSDGKIVCGLDESIAPGTSGPGTPGKNNDLQAVTMEIANSKGAPNWEISDTAMATVIQLCVDICKRNGIKKLNYTGDANGNLTYHQMFNATACPGPYLISKMKYIEQSVNALLDDQKLPEPEPTPTVTTTETIQYTVKKGDTLSAIAEKYGTTYQAIAKENNIKNPNYIKPGQVLNITITTETEAPVEKKADEPIKTATTTANLNVRTGPSTNYPVIGVFSKGSIVDIYEIKGQWAKVLYGSTFGWSNTNWLK
jgi:LysM repeat protein